MTKIIVKYDKSLKYNKYLCSFIELSGHAGYADYGHDIVCSGITTATYTSINLIDKINSKCFNLRVDDESGFLHMNLDYQLLTFEEVDLIQLIIKNLIDMYEEIKTNYPKYLKIEIL